MKRILVTGATGAMGKPLVQQLCCDPNIEVYATSRKSMDSNNRIHWLQGNAKENEFFFNLLTKNRFDAVVDYMAYSTKEFKERYEFVLKNTSHYIFTSSARVYARTEKEIDENSPRILDVCTDETYLLGDSYDLAKARQEDLLIHAPQNNWTIVRPSLTYNEARMQFTIFELEEWIYRVIDNNSLIFPKEMRNVVTTMTWGNDVADAVARLIGNENAYGDIFNISGGGNKTWGDILKIYTSSIEKITQRKVEVMEIDGVEKIAKHLNRYDQYRLARGISRRFSNNKIELITGKTDWKPIEQGLDECIQKCLINHYVRKWPSPRMAAYLDRKAGGYTPIKRFHTIKGKVGYVLYRFGVLSK